MKHIKKMKHVLNEDYQSDVESVVRKFVERDVDNSEDYKYRIRYSGDVIDIMSSESEYPDHDDPELGSSLETLADKLIKNLLPYDVYRVATLGKYGFTIVAQ